MSIKVGKFVLENEISRGGEGVVFEGVNSENQERIIAKRLILGDHSMEALQREFNILKIVKSNYLVTIYELIQSSNNLYAIYKKYGLDLEMFAKEWPGLLPELTFKKWAIQILRGMRDLHSNKIMHRDLKLRNILLTENSIDADAVIADFGVSIYSPKGIEEEYVGSREFMAPEIESGNTYDFKVDIFSYGRVLEVLGQKAELSSQTEEFIQMCTQADPQRRPTVEHLLQSPFVSSYLSYEMEQKAAFFQQALSFREANEELEYSIVIEDFRIGDEILDPPRKEVVDELVFYRDTLDLCYHLSVPEFPHLFSRYVLPKVNEIYQFVQNPGYSEEVVELAKVLLEALQQNQRLPFMIESEKGLRKLGTTIMRAIRLAKKKMIISDKKALDLYVDVAASLLPQHSKFNLKAVKTREFINK